MKKSLLALLVVLMTITVIGCGKKVDPNEKSEGSMTYAEFLAASAENSEDVTIEGFVQKVMYAKEYGNVCLYLQDGEGGYYVYRMPCNDEQAAKLKEGTKVIIKAQKAEWAGEVETKEGTGEFTVVEGKTWIADPKDVTSLLASEDLIKDMNKKIAVKGMKVVESSNGKAFMFNWDDSGDVGSNLYLTAEVDGANYAFVVDTDECAADSETYKAVMELNVGDTLDMEGFLYWYNGAEIHMTKVTKK